MSSSLSAGRRPLAAFLVLLSSLVLALSLLAASAAKAAPVLDLERLDGPTAIAMMDRGELTSVELTEAYIRRIEALNQQGPGLNAVSQFNPQALREAKKTDELRAEGKSLGPAMGLPILLKDLIDAKGMYTSAGNWSLRDNFPETDSGVAKALRDHGVVILGKVGLSEYAHFFAATPTGGAAEPSGFSNLTGQVINAVDADQSPGGSSSGSGASAAAAMSMLTIGTSTGGSISSPSRAQGLIGLTPTLGLVPGYGIAPIAASQDTAGPMERTMADIALTMESIAVADPLNDYTGIWGPGVDDDFIVPPLPNPIPKYMAALDLEAVKGMRIGYTNTEPVTLQAKEVLEAAGATLVERPTVPLKEALPPSVFPYEAARDVTRYYQRLGASAPIKSIQEEVADNEANPHEALKYGNKSHHDSALIDTSPNSAASVEYRQNLVKGKELSREQLDRMFANDNADPADDFDALIGAPPNPTRPGYPWLTLPMGYGATNRQAQFVYVQGPAYTEPTLISIGYAVEQGMLAKGLTLRKPVSEVNPSMYRCAKTVPAPAFAERGGCNADHDSTLALAGGTVPDLPFPLESETAAGLAERMDAGTLTAVDLTKAYLARIAVANTTGPAIQAVREVNDDALSEAAALDAERAGGNVRGPLHGIPVLLDDGIDATGLPSTGGSIALQGSLPDADSALVARLKDAGAIVLGKTNVSELNGLFSATMPEGYSSLAGQILLPSDTDKNPAGSSAGAAGATAAGMAAMAVGMETSPDSAQLIAPAAVAGVVGLKPTVGRVSRAGVMPVARSQDSPGPIAKTVADAAAQLQAIAGPDPADPATAGAPAVGDYVGALDPEALDGKTVAVVDNSAAAPGVKPAYDEALVTFADLGATTVTRTIAAAAPNPIVGREFGRDLDGYLDGLSGGDADSIDEIVAYNEANPVEGLKYQQGQLQAAAAVDLTDPAQKASYEADLANGKAADEATIDGLLAGADLIAVPEASPLVAIADRAGYPALTVPAGFGPEQSVNGRNPIGIVFVAGAFEEEELLAAGFAFEQASEVRSEGPADLASLPGASGAPSFTNPSMWRCVELSEFYSPHHCRPGLVEPLVIVPPTEPGPAPTPEPPATPGPAGPKLTLKVKPSSVTVGPQRKFVAYEMTVENVGGSATGRIFLCAGGPPKRVGVVGKRCVRASLLAGAERSRTVTVKIKPKAVGKTTRLKLTVRGAAVAKKQKTVSLTVKDD